MLRRFVLCSSLMILGSCAYTLDGADQKITLITPGANNAICYVWVNNFKYKMRPPQTMTIVKSKEDMMVDCRAPGNRQRKIYVGARLADNTYWNAVNGMIPGTSWDVLSNAAFEYPSEIEVDFRYMEQREQPLPDQNAPDIKQPEEYPLEEFLPGRLKLNSDRYAPEAEIKRRERGSSLDDMEGRVSLEPSTVEIDQGPVIMKGDLEQVIDSIGGEDANVSVNPAPVDSGTSSEEPLYPIE